MGCSKSVIKPSEIKTLFLKRLAEYVDEFKDEIKPNLAWWFLNTFLQETPESCNYIVFNNKAIPTTNTSLDITFKQHINLDQLTSCHHMIVTPKQESIIGKYERLYARLRPEVYGAFLSGKTKVRVLFLDMIFRLNEKDVLRGARYVVENKAAYDIFVFLLCYVHRHSLPRSSVKTEEDFYAVGMYPI